MTGPRGIEPPLASPGQLVEHGPEQVRNEYRWRVRLADGRPAVLAQLLPELAADQAVRRRYVYEVERLARLEVACVAPLLAVGPMPDPRDPDAASPWRLRAAPPGQSLAAWLARPTRPLAEVVTMLAALADAMHAVHRAGAVLRDLEPRNIVLDTSGQACRIWLIDVGLARLDILSTRTASSLVLERSPHAAPEHLRATLVDPRADLYTLGVIAWQALTGTLPHGEAPSFARADVPLAPLQRLRPDVPASLDALLRACLAEDPDRRPASAAEVAGALRGQPAVMAGVAAGAAMRVTCQACGARLRPGLRLCLRCGKTAVQLAHVAPGAADSYSLYLDRATEDEAFQRNLRELLETFAEDGTPHPEFLVGDVRMYSMAERAGRISLPAPIFRDLPLAAARILKARFNAAGLSVSIRPSKDRERSLQRRGRIFETAGFGTMGLAFVGMVAGAGAGGVPVLVFGACMGAIGVRIRAMAKTLEPAPMARLRAAPAALPASDPLVARVAGLLAVTRRPDVRERVGHLALLVQRLCDHRAAVAGATEDASAETLAMVTEPVAPLVDLVERAVRAMADIDDELAHLDEGELVRAIAASEARGEARVRRAALLDGLDRLRALEDRRGAHMQRLLEAASLLERAVRLGLDVEDARGQAERDLREALAALDGGT